MSELDSVNEELAYLKLWLRIVIATDLNLIGRLLGNFHSAHWLLVGQASAGGGVISTSASILSCPHDSLLGGGIHGRYHDYPLR